MRLGIGTAQFGLHYGVTNTTGQMDKDKAIQILEAAISKGTFDIDTSPSYGKAEKVIGEVPKRDKLRVITKTIKHKSPTITQGVTQQVIDGFYNSLKSLKLESCYALLIHDISDLTKPGFEVLLSALKALKSSGKVKKLGVSAYYVNEIELASDLMELDIIQVPLNVANQDFLETNTLKLLKANGVEIHARSVFLQGALLATQNQLPKKLELLSEKAKQLALVASKMDVTPSQLCLEFIKQTQLVDTAIVGVNSIFHLFQLHEDNKISLDVDWDSLKITGTRLTNPNYW